MKYIKTTLDDLSLLENIQRAETLTKKRIILTASKETQDYFEKQYVCPKYAETRVPQPYTLVAKYLGYKMLRDDTLEFGEIKIYSECS